MKSIVKLLTGFFASAFVFALALTVPGIGSAEAYTSYSNSSSNYTYYGHSSSYAQPSNNTQSANYSNYSKGSNYTNYSNYTKYGNSQASNYTNYTNYQKPTYNTPGQSTSNPGQVTNPSSPGSVSTSDEQAMLNLINKERAAAGLKPLTMDAALSQVARMKAEDMIRNNYFSHQSPTYGSPFDMMKSNGITYRYAGENLAGAPDVNTAHTNLMNSSGHRANILKSEYTKVGIGSASGGSYGKVFVQMFNG
ncbi:CAP domain-containing protein [Desulforamulus ruminis]|uniref:SCP-like extracellular n=1 Tax=Desulforamulus ruminis (strain ATCC 23193 / DSM 2154 / NCIMB 8452 / DL) TaxID=696281 RepID=F6DJX9_DESRL|nr:CAP domain-containing protein [Desulforamulus ruminis]AEG59193.1 SCP-like extracellular [Desulforamulus ruminis DSM 2154]